MSDNLYYKYIKLVSGDDIVCKTTDDCTKLFDQKILCISDPVVLNPVRVPKGDMLVESYIMYPWFSFSSEEVFQIPTTQIVLAVNIKENLKENYLLYLASRAANEMAEDDQDLDDDTIEDIIDEFLNTIGDEINEEKDDQRDGTARRGSRRNTRIVH